MRKDLYFHPTLSEANYKNFGLEAEDFTFSYRDVILDFDQKGILANPEDELWKAQNNGVRIRTSVKIKSEDALYGRTGILCTGARIGFYVIWSNPNTMQSGCEPLDSDDGINYFLDQIVPPEHVKGTLYLELHAYVARRAEEVLEGEEFLMNEPGVSLGTLATEEILLNDDHLSFPILKVTEDDKPMWWVEINWDDPEVDRFDNSITVYLNKKFKTYPKSVNDSELLCTIISTVYFLIIKKLKAKDKELVRNVFNSDHYDEYSVCNVMHYFFGTLQYLDVDDLRNLSDEKLLLELQREINTLYEGDN